MKGNQRVIDELKKLLAGELAARDQYFIHSRMFDDWGLSKLAEHFEHEMEEETGHADEHFEHEMEEETGHADLIIKRILFLEGTPDLNQQDPVNIGSNVKEIMEHDLALEQKVDAAWIM